MSCLDLPHGEVEEQPVLVVRCGKLRQLLLYFREIVQFSPQRHHHHALVNAW